MLEISGISYFLFSISGFDQLYAHTLEGGSRGIKEQEIYKENLELENNDKIKYDGDPELCQLISSQLKHPAIITGA